MSLAILLAGAGERGRMEKQREDGMHGRILAFGFWFLALAVACASGGDDDDDSSTGSGSDDDSTDDDVDDDDDAGDDDVADDDDNALDDDADDDVSDDDDDDDDVEPSCEDVWAACNAENPRETDFEEECGPYPAADDPDFVEKWADFNACRNTVLSHWAGDVHDCGVTDGCEDETAAYFECLETWYEETSWCYSTGGPDLLDYAECLPDYECGTA